MNKLSFTQKLLDVLALLVRIPILLLLAPVALLGVMFVMIGEFGERMYDWSGDMAASVNYLTNPKVPREVRRLVEDNKRLKELLHFRGVDDEIEEAP